MRTSTANSFEDVDRSADPSRSVSYLEAATALDGAQKYKLHTFALMGTKPGDSILDVGCGTGSDLRKLAEMVGTGGRVVGVDSSETMLAQARARTAGLPVDCRAGDAHQLDFPTDAFDATCCDRVLQHLLHPEQAFAELVRVTRRDGRIVVAEPDWDTLMVDAPDKAVTRAITQAIADNNRNPWIGRQLLGLARRNGLIDVQLTGFTIVLDEWSQANPLLHLQEGAERAASNQAISAAEADAWVKALLIQDAARLFFSAITLVVVSGVKA